MSERKTVTVDQNYRQDNVFLEQVLLRAAIQTSEFLALTQDTAYDAKGPGVCFVAETADYTVHGDVVRVCGPIRCPGRALKIVCRVLEFYPDSQLRPAAIIVDGQKGEDGGLVVGLPKHGADGVGLRDLHSPSDIYHHQSSGVDGGVGEPGNPGNNGAPGHDGGTIEIHCQTLFPTCSTTLSAKGGNGGSGSR